ITGVSTGFKTYAVEWTPTKMVFSVDSVVHYTYEPATRDSNTWPFDDPQYLLFNVAIQSSIAASFTESPMIVDYVRVYQSSTLSNKELEAASIEVYPNPSSDIIHVVQPFEIATIKIFDITGKLVKYEALQDITNIINTVHLAPGTYQCTVTNEQNGQSVQRVFIKQ
ncbi:MAG: T9SS type A sorting domain-containing protein, partial [Flavobacteriales bacterium]